MIYKLTPEEKRGIAGSIGMIYAFGDPSSQKGMIKIDEEFFYFTGVVDDLKVLYYKLPTKATIVDDICYTSVDELMERLPLFKAKVVAEKV